MNINLNHYFFTPLLALCFVLLWGCDKGAGYLSIDGETVLNLDYGYHANKEAIGLGKACWTLYEKQTDKSQERPIVCIQATDSGNGGSLTPASIVIWNLTGYSTLYLDEINKVSDNRYTCQVRKDETEFTEYTITVDALSSNSSYTYLTADISFTSRAETIRIHFSGPTPDDGKEYALD